MLKNNIILDCDTGEDDALAILVSIANKLPIRYVVSSYGNTSLENATKNTSGMLSLSHAKNVKVLKGASSPLKPNPLEKNASAGDFVGKNGLCDAKVPESTYDNILTSENDQEYVEKLINILKKESPVSYIITGPCTNFAKVCLALGEEIKQYVSSLYIMGGAIHADGNTGPLNPDTGKQYAEFNFYLDPEAVKIVLQTGIPIYMITWDITSTVTIPYKTIETFKSQTSVGDFCIDLMKSFFKYYGLAHDRNFELNDPITVLAYMGYGKYKKEKIKIITEGQQYGRTIKDTNGFEVQYFYLEEKEIEEVKEKIIKDIDII